MKNWKKRLIALFMAIALVVTMFPNSMGVSEVEAAQAVDGTLEFTYRWGLADTLQVNTNLPAGTTCANFTADDNGCAIDQTGSAQNVGWIGMEKEDGTIVLTFHFNKAFEAGKTYVLKQGSVFEFTDGSSYTLDADYTFKWDGSAWSCRKERVLDMALHGGGDFYLQTRHTIPAGLTYVKEQSTLDYKSSTGVPAERIDFPATGIMSINFSGEYTCTEGDTFTWKAGSTFAFQEAPNQYVYYTLQNTWLFTYTSSGWNLKREVAVESVSGEANYLQPILNISSTDDNATLSKELFNEEGGTLTSSGIASYNRNGKALLSVNLSEPATVGDTYVWNKGSTCTISGVECYFADTFVFTYTAEGWTVETKVPEQTFTFASCSGANSYLHVLTDIPVASTCAKFDIQKEGTKQDDGITVFSEGQTAQLLSFNYGTNHCAAGDTLKIKKGSTMQLENGNTYVLKENWLFVFDGQRWSSAKETEITGIHSQTIDYIQPKLSAPAPLTDGNIIGDNLDDSGSDVSFNSMTSHAVDKNAIVSLAGPTETVTEGMHYIWNANSIIKIESTQYYLESSYVFTYLDGHWKYFKGALGDINADEVVDSRDLVKLKRIQADSSDYDIRYDLAADKEITTLDVKRERYILIGVSWESYTNSAEYLLAESNFNGGGEFVTFADCPPDPTDADKMQEYKALGFNTSLIAVNEDNTNKEYVTMDVEDTDYQLEPGEKELQFTALHSESSELIMLTTDLPSGISVDPFTAEDTPHVINKDWSKRPGWFSVLDDGKTNKVYLNLHFAYDKLVEGDYVILKAGTKLKVSDTYYVLTQNYTLKYLSYYHDAIDTLKSLDLHAWLRNDSNETDLMTADRLNKIAPYAEDVDGVYFTDEPFWTATMQDKSNTLYNTKENLMDFEDIKKFAKTDGNFNTYFSGKYFHVNHSGVTSFNKYCTVPIQAFNMPEYYNYLTDYTKNAINNASTDDAKKTIGFDHYPFGYKTFSRQWVSGKSYLAENLKEFQTKGISPYYLINLLISAKVAKEKGNSMSVAIQTYLNTSGDKKKRAIENKEEITMQLYATMACGVDVYEYYLYNTVTSEKQYGIIDADGNKTGLYTHTQNANKEALPFADVLKTFEWNGAEFFLGNSQKNREAKTLVDNNNSTLSLVLNDDSDGVLNGVSSATDDILVGYYTKGGQDAYMIANYNDPKLVDTPNSVTLNFGECNYARVYTGTANGLKSETVVLDGGSYTFSLKPGGGCFVIPVNAAS